MFVQPISYWAALTAGLLSFFSPCIVPLVPGYFTFITGFSLDDLVGANQPEIRRKVVISTLAFVLGFSSVFILMGASASLVGGLTARYQGYIRIAGGVFVVLLGVHLMGLLRIPQLEVDKRIHIRKKPLHALGTFLVGMAFAAGWTPCVGPLLGSILIVAGSQESVGQGVMLLGVYSLGLAAPFLVLSVFIHLLLKVMKKIGRVAVYANRIAGALLVAVGILLITDRLSVFYFG